MNGKTYDVFVRDWWREATASDGKWPNNLVPCTGEKTYIARDVTEEEAREICEEYNNTHEPGRYSRKAELYHPDQGRAL